MSSTALKAAIRVKSVATAVHRIAFKLADSVLKNIKQ
jgi:hypothetical protein